MHLVILFKLLNFQLILLCIILLLLIQICLDFTWEISIEYKLPCLGLSLIFVSQKTIVLILLVRITKHLCPVRQTLRTRYLWFLLVQFVYLCLVFRVTFFLIVLRWLRIFSLNLLLYLLLQFFLLLLRHSLCVDSTQQCPLVVSFLHSSDNSFDVECFNVAVHCAYLTSTHNFRKFLLGQIDYYIFGFQICVDNFTISMQVVQSNQNLLGHASYQWHWDAFVVVSLHDFKQVYTQDFKYHNEMLSVSAVVQERI